MDSRLCWSLAPFTALVLLFNSASAAAQGLSSQFTGSLADGGGNPITNVQVSASIPNSGTNNNLQITTTSATGRIDGRPISFFFQLQATNGTTPYVWALASGSAPLPPGLGLSTNGLISGTPSGPVGVTMVIISVTDANSLTTTSPFQINLVDYVVSPSTLRPINFSVSNGFQFTASAPAGGLYTVQFSTSLTNWISLFDTNPPVTPFTIVDRTATNQSRVYRLLNHVFGP